MAYQASPSQPLKSYMQDHRRSGVSRGLLSLSNQQKCLILSTKLQKVIMFNVETDTSTKSDVDECPASFIHTCTAIGQGQSVERCVKPASIISSYRLTSVQPDLKQSMNMLCCTSCYFSILQGFFSSYFVPFSDIYAFVCRGMKMNSMHDVKQPC